MEETDVCKSCYGKKQYSVYTGYTRSWDFLWEEGGRIDRQENKMCPRCSWTGKEPEKVIKQEEQKTFENSSSVEFVRGEEVEVRNDHGWHKRIYLGVVEWVKNPYKCVSENDEQKYIDWEEYRDSGRKHIRKLPKQEVGHKKFFIKKDIELFTTYNHMKGSEWQAIYLFLKTHGMLEE